MTTDTIATISAFAAAGAALGAIAVALVQLYVGKKQSDAALLSAKAAMLSAENAGRHAVAAFRQKWIDTLRDTVAEHHALLMSTTEYPYPEEKDKQLSQLGTKIELLLNPTESLSDDLLRITEEIYNCPDVDARVKMDPKLVAATRAILKVEWEKVKAELQPPKSA